MNWIEQAVDFIEMLDPGFSAGLVGARMEDIRRLEHVVGHDLPTVYIHFLERMGRGMSWLTFRKADFHITAVRRYYENWAWRPPDRYTLIGVVTEDPYYSIYLDSGGGIEPRVVAFPYSHGAKIEDIERVNLIEVAGSLPEALCGTAFETVRFAQFPLQKRYDEETGRVGAIRAVPPIMDEMRFQKLWFSTETGIYFRRDDCVLRAIQRPKRLLSFHFAAQDEPTAQAVAAGIAKHLPLLER